MMASQTETARPTKDTARQTKNQTPVASSARLMSLDALRGFDMFWIIGGWFIVHNLMTFNEAFIGSAPDLGAHEAGSDSMEFGASAYRPHKRPGEKP